MYIAEIPNRNSRPAILLRESFREGGKVKSRTLANLSNWPAERIERLRSVLRDDNNALPPFEIIRSLPHGHVAAVLGMAKKLDLLRLISRSDPQMAALCVAMIVSRILSPASKLSTARMIHSSTCASSLGEELELEQINEEALYRAMDDLFEQQERIETALAKRHLREGCLVLYDVSSTWFEGRCCPLAKLGYSRDGRKDRPQIVFGLLTSSDGCPVAIEVFEGNTADPNTLKFQIEKVIHRFALKKVVLVGDRGMITEARIREEIRTVPGLDWISALRAPAIQGLVSAGTLQLSLFDEKDLAEISSPDYPGERLIVCRNPLLAERRTRKREDLLQATEKEMEKIKQATLRERAPLHSVQDISLRLGRVAQRFKMKKHFILTIEQGRFDYQRNLQSIVDEAALDGIYVVRTSLPSSAMASDTVVATYKRLSAAERAFRSMKTVDLKIRPIFHRHDKRVRAHVFLCMLAYYVEWHMRQALAPILFDDEVPEEGRQRRANIVKPAQRSLRAEQKAHRKKTEDGTPVHSFQSLLRDLATITKNRIQPLGSSQSFDISTRPTPVQQKALDLLAKAHRAL
jgi:transposase